jgi:integrase
MKTVADRDIKFLLKDARATGATLIYLVYRYGTTRFKYSTGQTVEPYQWDADHQRAVVDPRRIKTRHERETNGTINAHLDRHRAALLKVVNRLQLSEEPITNDTIRLHLDKETGKERKEEPAKPGTEVPKNFTGYIERFVEDATNGHRLNVKSQRFAPITIKSFAKLQRTLERYKAETRRGVDYTDFTIEQYHALKLWLTGKGLSLNYIGALLKDLKQLLKQSYGEGLHTNTVFQHRDFKRMVEEVDNVYLTDSELQQLTDLNLTRKPRLDRVRDLFLIGAYTGLRFSDYSELRPENITHNGRILTRKTLKTSERVSIPLNPNVLAILSKYAGVPPRTISNQRMNKYIKELILLAGFTERVEVGRTRGGTKETHYLEKWELVSTHTARRSFATNAFLGGVPTVNIMKCTGHKSETVFMKYIKITSEQNALLLLDHPHFGGAGSTTDQPAIVRPLHKAA